MYRPTAASIWNSFRSSGKRHLLLTGGHGTGKTSRINELHAGMPGIITYAVPQNGVYLQSYPNGEKIQIGLYDPQLPGLENKMRICPESFETQAVSAVRKLAQAASEWIFIDEIGYLESGSASYQTALRKLFEQKCVIAAVRKQDTAFLLEIQNRPDVFCINLDAPFGNTGCVIMASGQSKRFGSNKLMADFRGVPMIQHILCATQGIFKRRVVVTRHPEIVELCQEQGVHTILHHFPYRSDTVRLGLASIGGADSCMFCPADQPLLSQNTVASLVLCAAHDQSSIWRPCFGGNPGAPVLFPRWTFEELVNLPQGKGGGLLLRRYPERIRMLPVSNPAELMDVDDHAALEKLLQLSKNNRF